MVIDSAHFPLVWMKISTDAISTDGSGFSAFEALLAREEAFVVLDEGRASPEQHQHTTAEKKQLSLWMKRHKSALRTFVKAHIHIEPDFPRRQAAKAFALVFEAFWGYPMFVVATATEALKLAHKLIAQE